MLKTFALILFITGNDGNVQMFELDTRLSLSDCAAYQAQAGTVKALSNTRVFLGCVVEDGVAI